MDAGKKASVTTKIHEIYIRSTPETIWSAITSPEWNDKYGYRAAAVYELKPGGKYAAKATAQMRTMGLPETIIDGEVLEAHPPRKLVQTFRFLFNEQNRAEGFTRVTWEIEPTASGFCRLTVTHELDGAPIMAAATSGKYSEKGGGGWAWIISDLKSLLETGKSMSG
ncbi:MAG: transcriptional regulator [Rhodospirillaceae bacterium]|nr:MAG: transcriptional regulator [Rhodospirillaceae bacterium]